MNSLEVSREDIMVASRVGRYINKMLYINNFLYCTFNVMSPIYRTRSYEQHELLWGPIDGTSAGDCRKRCWGFFFFFASPDIYFSHLSCFAPTMPAYPLDDALASVVFAMPTIGPLGYVLCPLLATWLTPSLQNHQVLHGPSRPQI